MSYSPSTPSDGITAQLISIPDPAAAPSPGCSVDDYAGLDVAGKIALVQRGACTFADKSQSAKLAGAVAVIVYNSEPGALMGTVGTVNDTNVPIGGISQQDGESILAQIQAGTVNALLNIQTTQTETWSSSVIADTRHGDHSNVVVFSAHLDSVPEGPGINDNGSGSITILELALKLSKYKHKNAARFIWFSAEEPGLVGSENYVANLTDKQVGDIALAVNLDMVASPNWVYAIYDATNKTGLNVDDGPPGSKAIETVFESYFKHDNNTPTVLTALDARSDYSPFAVAGIPVGGLYTGAEEIKTDEEARLFGGTAGQPLDPNYHAAGDDYGNLAFEPFLKNVKASAYALATFVKSTEKIEAQQHKSDRRLRKRGPRSVPWQLNTRKSSKRRIVRPAQ